MLAGTGDYVGFFTAQTFGIMRSTDGGSTWSQTLATTGLTTAATATRIVGSPSSTAGWGTRTWTRADLTDANCSRANLAGANLSDATMARTLLSRANLTEAVPL